METTDEQRLNHTHVGFKICVYPCSSVVKKQWKPQINTEADYCRTPLCEYGFSWVILKPDKVGIIHNCKYGCSNTEENRQLAQQQQYA